MNKIESQKVLRYAKKIKAIKYLGGSCKICNELNIFKLTFHHRDPNEKEFQFSVSGKDKRWSIIKSELDKCDLLCQNCHREIHFNLKNESSVKDEKRRNDKLIYLEYSDSSCIRCGYNKCPASLTFHHRDPNEKEFCIGGLSERINSIDELNEIIKNEIDKCDLLCANCHVIEHSDISFFEQNKLIIENKVQKYKEIQSKLNRLDVYKMYDDGFTQKEISNYFKSSMGTISGILKPYKIKKNIKINAKVDRELIYELYDQGLKQVDIIKKLKISRDTIYRALKNRN